MATCSGLNRPKLTNARYVLLQVAVRSSRQKRDGTEFIGQLKSTTAFQEKHHGEKVRRLSSRPGWTFRPRHDCSRNDDTAIVLAISRTLAHCSDRRRYGERM